MNDSLPIVMHFCPATRATLSFVATILATAMTTLQAAEPRQLKGTQSQKVVTLVRSISPYIVTGIYEVPPDSELIVEAGTKVLFAKDAGLNIRGKLLINGNESNPVELTGKATGAGTWRGVRIDRSDATRIEHARITGAKHGLYVHACKPSINSTILASNIVGLYGANTVAERLRS